MAAVRWRPTALLVFLVAAAHGASLGGVFHFDDHHSLVDNPHIRSLASIPRFFTDAAVFSRNPGSDMYRPVVLASYAANYAAGRLDPRGYHAVNLAVHLATTLVVLATLRRLGLGGAALAAAALFAVHPLTSQPVNYVSSRSESLAALFAWACLLLYLGPGTWRRAGSVLAFAAALGSKAVSVWVPAALVLLAWRDGERRIWRRQWPYWVLTAGYLAAVRSQLSEAFVSAPVRSLSTQMWTQAKALVYYARLVAVPRPLTVEHDFAATPSWAAPVVVTCLLVLAWVGVRTVRAARGGRLPGLLACWALLVLLPTMVTPLNVLVSEQRIYAALPSAGALVALSAAHLRYRWPVLGVAVLLLSSISWQRTEAWATEISLWRDADSKTRLAARPHVQLGALYRRAGDLRAAAAHLDTALRLAPDDAAAHGNLGNVLLSQGRLAEAEASYQRALELLPRYPEALTNLGVLRGRQGRWEEALALHEAALRVSPDRAEVLVNAAVALLELGRYSRSEALLRRVLAQGAVTAAILYDLGGALEGQGEVEAAAAAYLRAVDTDPTYAKPYLRLARIHDTAGRRAPAREAYEDFLQRWRGDPAVAESVRRRVRDLSGEAR